MILGISAGYHDAAISLINRKGDIIFAGHSERYSKIKFDPNISKGLIDEIKDYHIDTISFYERPWIKQLAYLRSGKQFDWARCTTKQVIKDQCHPWLTKLPKKIESHKHHLSHAAAGFQTSPFTSATVVVIDAIGEFDTVSIWGAEYNHMGHAKYKLLWNQSYPHSLGLFYSAVTKKAGLHPMDEEHILMGMSAYGSPQSANVMQLNLIENESEILFKHNLHIGIDESMLPNLDPVDLAAGAQRLLERLVYNIMCRARNFKWSNNLVYMGGVALNCVANRHLGDYFENIWIMPNPGDAGSSLGAAALSYGMRINFDNAYLGHNISGRYPSNMALDYLLKDGIVGVASGRAEFGPRALGNRSLFADPRIKEVKDRLNDIKHREKFRPFAPVILSELADDYFYMKSGWNKSPYMQSIAICKRPDLYPSICHVDDTSRVQTVDKNGSGIRELLEKWYLLTGCPMLLNTSLNIKGEPIVNDIKDAKRFEELYGVKVCS